jgi:hypothetical protein
MASSSPLLQVGLATEFRFKKIPRNRLGMASVIPRKKELIQRHSEVYGRVNSEAQSGRNGMKKISFTKNPAPANSIDSMFFVREMLPNGTEFREFASIFFLPRNEIPSIFLLCVTVRNGILRDFCSAEWFRTEFREFASIFVHGTEFRAFFSSAERNSEGFLFRGTDEIPLEQTNCSVYSVFRGIIFFFLNCQPYLQASITKQIISPLPLSSC